MNKRLITTSVNATLAGVALVATCSLAVAQTPIAYYKFNEPAGSTTLADSSGNGFDATYRDTENAPSFGTGIQRGAWQGNGGALDSFITAEITALSGIEDLSISLWINPDGTPGFDGLFVTRTADVGITSGDPPEPALQNWGLNQQGTGIDARTNGAATDSTNDLTVGVWTHVAMVYDGFNGTNTIYVNGVASNDLGGTAPVDVDWVTGGVWDIGDDRCCGGREWAGLMDEVALFDTALSATDVMDIFTDGSNGIALDGSTNPQPGDVDGDGDVDGLLPGADDLDPIIANFLDDVTGMGDTRPFGDLTNDGVVGLADFREWKDNFPFPGGGSLESANVPEPGSVALLAVAGLAGFVVTRRPKLRVGVRGLAILMAAALTTTVNAQVVATIDQDTGVVTVANEGVTTVTFDGYEISSGNGLLDSVGWSGFNEQLVAGWEVLGTPSANTIGEALTTSGAAATVPGPGTPINFGATYDPSTVIAQQLAAGLGVEVRDVSFGYLEPGNSTLTQATINYVGETVTNNLVLKVNRQTGVASLENESPFNVTIDAFAITSGGSLNDSWAGSPDLTAPDWLLGSPSSTGVGQVSPQSSVTLDAAVNGSVQAGGTINLGDIFSTGNLEDLNFAFLRVGEDDGDGFAGVVEYVGNIPGDYDGDELLTAADYTVWRDTLGSTTDLRADGDGSGTVDEDDYTFWVNAYNTLNAGAGAGSLSGGNAPVPEPASLCLALVGIVGLALRRGQMS